MVIQMAIGRIRMTEFPLLEEYFSRYSFSVGVYRSCSFHGLIRFKFYAFEVQLKRRYFDVYSGLFRSPLENVNIINLVRWSNGLFC